MIFEILKSIIFAREEIWYLILKKEEMMISQITRGKRSVTGWGYQNNRRIL
jgi:hypothetical protein